MAKDQMIWKELKRLRRVISFNWRDKKQSPLANKDKAWKDVEFELDKPFETFLISPLNLEGNRLLRVTVSEVSNSALNITEENSKSSVFPAPIKKILKLLRWERSCLTSFRVREQN